MKPPKPLPTRMPFLSIYTTTYRRPAALARNLRSVESQTAVELLEQIVIPDLVGYGIVDGLYTRLAWYAEALRGQYIHILPDDDCLATERVVEDLRAFAIDMAYPDVIVATARKGDVTYPRIPVDQRPEDGDIDLTSYIVRRDVWREHVHDYGRRYAGDVDHARALLAAGYHHARFEPIFVVGDNHNGRPEY
jgi:hypothetical protein